MSSGISEKLFAEDPSIAAFLILYHVGVEQATEIQSKHTIAFKRSGQRRFGGWTTPKP